MHRLLPWHIVGDAKLGLAGLNLTVLRIGLANGFFITAMILPPALLIKVLF